MSMLTRFTLAAALAAALAAPAAAETNNLAPGGGFKVYKAQLGIKGPDGGGCGQFKLMAWVYVSHPTTIQVMFARQGQGAGPPISLQSKKASNGQYVATYQQTLNVASPIATAYRVLVGGGSGVTSNWVPLAC